MYVYVCMYIYMYVGTTDGLHICLSLPVSFSLEVCI